MNVQELKELNIILRNTGKALEITGSLSTSYIYRFVNPDAFMMGTRVNAADENWAWVRSASYSPKLLADIIEKFEKRSAPFVWPVFPDASAAMEADMDKAGLLRRGTLGAMIFDSVIDTYSYAKPGNVNLSSQRVLSLQDIFLWSDVCWRAFTDEKEPQSPPDFILFARHAALNDKIRLMLVFIDDEPAGTAMLTQCDGTYISHFSVLPKWRNRGAGSFLMNEIMKHNKLLGKRFIALLATNMGETLYGKFGFRKCADIHLRSFSEL